MGRFAENLRKSEKGKFSGAPDSASGAPGTGNRLSRREEDVPSRPSHVRLVQGSHVTAGAQRVGESVEKTRGWRRREGRSGRRQECGSHRESSGIGPGPFTSLDKWTESEPSVKRKVNRNALEGQTRWTASFRLTPLLS
jgi:hypothetical protein